MSFKSFSQPLIVLVTWFLCCAVCVPAVSAETRVEYGRATGTIMWDAAHSPYVLDGTLTMMRGSVLHIGPGVEVLSGVPTAPLAVQPPVMPGIEVFGRLEIDGTSSSPVVLRGLSGVTISQGELDAHDVSFSNMRTGLSLVGSRARVDRAVFADNEIAVGSRYPVFLVDRQASTEWGTGGIGNALVDSDIVIRDSVFSKNKEYDVYNTTKELIDARYNHWDDNSPKTYGPIDTSDFYFDVMATSTASTTLVVAASSSPCCSNVLFLPGIQASRLYIDEESSTNRLWEPNRNDDARKLYRSATNNNLGSGSPSIYTRDVIDNAFGYTVYGDFIKKMDEEVASGKVREWKAYPYDWRGSVADVARSSVLMDIFSGLASSSLTGKVTIVAHSNGGLLAKAFGKVLDEKGLGGMVDKVVFVAVPQLGTPQAIGALLHGDNQSILDGLILTTGVARHLGLTSVGAYGLVPPKKFLEQAVGNIISFATSTIASFDFSKYGAGISQEIDLDDFLTARRDGRAQPSDGEPNLPAVLDPSFLSSARHTHDELDDWRYGSTTSIYSLIGWGRPTMESLQYEERRGCFLGGTCITHLLMTPRNSILGDGTVLSRSASAYSAGNGRPLFVNLDKEHENVVHSNILSSASVLNAISTIISSSSSDALSNSLYSISNISDHIPDEYTGIRTLRMGVHSPVDLHVYDLQGNHTGRAKNPFPDSDLEYAEHKIPGSSYSVLGEDKYVSIEGVTSKDQYVISVVGTGDGVFDLDIEESLGDTVVATSSFRTIPVTVGMSATTTVRVLDNEKIQVDPLSDDGFDMKKADESQQTLFSRHAQSRATSSSTTSLPSVDIDINNHVHRIVDLIKKNKKFLSSMSVGDRVFLLDLLQML